MASTSDKAWREQAQFMRDVGALHAEWVRDPGTDEVRLSKLVLGPPALPRTPAPHATIPAAPKADGPAAKLAKMHATMFAASSMRPPPPQTPNASAAVPRADRAKKAAARGTKKQKRSS